MMLAAISFDTLVFIALVLVAGFFRWIAKQAEKAKQDAGQDAPARPNSVPPREGTDEERVRRFLEALGQPTSRPSPRIERPAKTPREKRAAIPHGRTIFSPLPRLTTVPPPLPVEAQEPTPLVLPAAAPEVARAGVTMVSPKEKFPEPSAIAFPDTARPAPAYPEITALLSSERGLRDAIIVREILGPPRSLQTLEF